MRASQRQQNRQASATFKWYIEHKSDESVTHPGKAEIGKRVELEFH